MFTRLTRTFAFTTAATAASILSAVGIVLVPNSSFAATLPVPTVEYSADRVMETDKGNFTGKVYAAGDKQRTEMNMGGMRSVMIIRKDKQLGYMLMPTQNMYRQLDIASAQKQAGQPQDLVDITEVGSETIEGHATTKYKMIMKDGSAGGFMWITKDGIPVKLDSIVKEGNKKTRFTMTLTNLQVGKVDPAVFEVPAGYSEMPGGNLFGGGARGMRLPGMGR